MKLFLLNGSWFVFKACTILAVGLAGLFLIIGACKKLNDTSVNKDLGNVFNLTLCILLGVMLCALSLSLVAQHLM